MKKILLSLGMGTACLCALALDSVTWRLAGHWTDEKGKPWFTQQFIIRGDLGRFSRLCFNQVPQDFIPLNPADTIGEIIPGYYYVASPRFATGADSLVIEMKSRSWAQCPQYSFSAQGVHGVDAAGKPFDVDFAHASMTERPGQWCVPGRDNMPYGPEVFARNEELMAAKQAPGPFDMVPALKRVVPGKGVCRNPEIKSRKIEEKAGLSPEYYKIKIGERGVDLTAASPQGMKMAEQTLHRLADYNPDGIPVAVIEDWPDYPYRGMMIDAVRNFKPLADLRSIVDAMAELRMNRLQLHLADDEGWRIEIPALPELTEYASRRGYTTDEKEFPAQIYFGNGNPDSPANHGYYTRQQFIDFLRYCDERGITVIPEIETPGHARAAIKAMEYRYRKTGDDSFRMREDGDTSQYRSAQNFNDCVINPSLPGPYKFINTVADALIEMYREAGVPLEVLHIGGDEVPAGAWGGSPGVKALKDAYGLKTDHDVHGLWVERISDAMAAKGLKIAGWQEVGLGHSDEMAEKVAPNTAFINLWSVNSRDKEKVPGSEARRQGYPVLICAAPPCYLDFAYSLHPEEHGLNWGGTGDEYATLACLPADYAPAPEEGAKSDVIGIQGQLWSETLNTLGEMETYLFPRIFSIAERGWNGEAQRADSTYSRLLSDRELPRIAAQGRKYHIRQPGIILRDGKVVMNTPYTPAMRAEIRFTLDGTDPTAQSPLYTGPISAAKVRKGCPVRARIFIDGRPGPVTFLKD